MNVHKSSCRVTVTFLILKQNLNFLERYSKNSQISNLKKTVLCEKVVEFGRTDRQKNRHEIQ